MPDIRKYHLAAWQHEVGGSTIHPDIEIPADGEWANHVIGLTVKPDKADLGDTEFWREVGFELGLKGKGLSHWDVHPDEIRKVRLGLNFGLETENERLLGNFVDRERTSVAGSWRWTNEARMAKYLKDAVVEALVEKAQVPIDHWSKECAVYERWPQLKQDSTAGTEQQIAVLQQVVDAALPAARTNRDRAMIALLKLRRDLALAFRNATTFAQVETAAASYFKGTFGDDWYVRGFFHPTTREYRRAEKWFRKVEESDRLGRFAHPHTPAPNDWLKPFFKKYPNLGSMYGARGA